MFDAIIVGAGIGGYTAALDLAENNRTVALVDCNEVGGTCLNRGCIPTKAYLKSAELYDMANTYAAEYGICIDNSVLDKGKIYSNIKGTVEHIRGGLLGKIKGNANIKLMNGRAVVTGRHDVSVSSDKGINNIHAENIVLATGSEPICPEFPGVHNSRILTTDKAFEFENIVPERVLLIGGGVIGIEFAYILNRLGSKVAICEMQPCLINGFGREASDYALNYLTSLGIVVHCGAEVLGIEDEGDELIVRISGQDGAFEAIADNVLLAVGRKARSGEIELDGLIFDDGKIVTDELCRTGIQNVYAVGDVTNSLQLAYVAELQGHMVAKEIMGEPPCPLDKNAVPRCIYMHPEIAVIGDVDKLERSDGVVKAKILAGSNGKSVIEKQTGGFVKVYADRKSHRILGAVLICESAVDMAGFIGEMIAGGVKAEDVLCSAYPHPSHSEMFREAAMRITLMIERGEIV